MKGSEALKNTIKGYLDNRAANDELFAVAYVKEGKNIDDCCTYILNTVQKSGCNGFADEEIFGMAVHYYDEDSIEVGKKIDCQVVVNHVVELTEEEKAAAKQKAIDELVAQQRVNMTKKPVVKKPEAVHAETPSLFD